MNFNWKEILTIAVVAAVTFVLIDQGKKMYAKSKLTA